MLGRFLDFCARLLRMCGHGATNNWYVRVADRFFVDCPCCLFWRGVFIGVAASIVFALAATAGVHALHWYYPEAEIRAPVTTVNPVDVKLADLERDLGDLRRVTKEMLQAQSEARRASDVTLAALDREHQERVTEIDRAGRRLDALEKAAAQHKPSKPIK